MQLEKEEIKKKILNSQNDIYLMGLLANLLDEIILIHVDQRLDEFLGCLTYDKNANRLELSINKNISKEDFYITVIKHELLHLFMGHMLIDINYYNRMLLNIGLDAEINSYLVKDFQKSKYKLNPVNYMISSNKDEIKKTIEKMNNTKVNDNSYSFWSGKLNIMDREHWKNIYDFILKNTPEEIKDLLNQMTQDLMSMMNKDTDDTNMDDMDNKSQQTDRSNMKSKKINPSIQSNDRMLNENYSNNPFAVAAIEEAINNAIEKLQETTGNKNITNPGTELGNMILSHFDFKRKPIHVWKKKLKNVIFGSIPSLEIESSYKKLDRRLYNHSVRLPGTKQLFKPMINVVVDISGSMSELVPQVLRHLYSIGEQLDGINEIRFCDVETRKICKHISKSELKHLKVEEINGWGGTKLAKTIQESVSQHPDICVLITDLELWGDDFTVINSSCIQTKMIICTDKTKEYASKNIKSKYDHIDLNLIE